MSALANDKLIKISSVIGEVFGNELHKKRQQSLAFAAMGLLASESLFLHRMAEGLVKSRGIKKKHATKQIDRLLSNKGISIWDLCDNWVKYIIGVQQTVTVALDWSSFFDDEQSMLSLNIVSSKGLSTPLLWKSVENNRIKHNRARYEDQLLSRFKEALPLGVQVTLLADRGFADQKFLRFLTDELEFNYVIRIKSSTTITYNEVTNKALCWLKPNGRVFGLTPAMITLDKYQVMQFIAVHDKGMKAPWFLVSNMNLKSRQIIRLYSKRWKIGVSRLRTLHLVGESPTEVKDSSLVAWEASWRESNMMEPSDNIFGKEYAQCTRL
jgi:hypothetical protein